MMVVKDTKKQEFVAAAAAFAALLAERWYEGGGFTPSLVLPSPADEDEQMLSRGEVSKMLDLSTRTIDRLVKEKQLTPVRLTGRNPKFRKSEVERFIRRRE